MPDEISYNSPYKIPIGVLIGYFVLTLLNRTIRNAKTLRTEKLQQENLALSEKSPFLGLYSSAYTASLVTLSAFFISVLLLGGPLAVAPTLVSPLLGTLTFVPSGFPQVKVSPTNRHFPPFLSFFQWYFLQTIIFPVLWVFIVPLAFPDLPLQEKPLLGIQLV